MVVFTCNNCGETLQKPRVAKHYQFQCRTTAFLTCVDCFKDFRGDEYIVHTKCITEAERYGGKNFVPKPSANKGERKQQEWINIVNNLLESSTDLSNAERGFLNTLSRHENIPRKKAKFLNFVRSAIGNRINMQVVESTWNKMELAYKGDIPNATGTTQQNGNVKQGKDIEENVNGGLSKKHQDNSIAENQNNENIYRENQDEDHQNRNNESSNANNITEEEGQYVPKQKKSKKRAMPEITEDQKEEQVPTKKKKKTLVLSESSTNQCEDTSEKSNFNWKSTILNIVQSKGEISLKKLQKKVISQYMNHCPGAVTYEKASTKFDRKLKKVTEIVITENKVKLA